MWCRLSGMREVLDRATAGRAGMGVAATERPVTSNGTYDFLLQSDH